VLILACLGCLCQEAWEKETFQLDPILLLWLHQWVNPLRDRLMLSITRLGDPELVSVMVLVNLCCFFGGGDDWLQIFGNLAVYWRS
jgi:hypothetical protein